MMNHLGENQKLACAPKLFLKVGNNKLAAQSFDRKIGFQPLIAGFSAVIMSKAL